MRGQTARSYLFLTILVAAFLVAPPVFVFGHGGEDHGDQKPKSTANAKGIISHSARLGDFEVMVKHPLLEPDQATAGRLFITKFESNEPFRNAGAMVELESANGTLFTAALEAAEQPGAYSVKFPALPEGTYTMRAKVTYDGETDTATFAGIDVKPTSPAGGEGTSWFVNGPIGILFCLVVLILGGLVYFVWRFTAEPAAGEGALSA